MTYDVALIGFGEAGSTFAQAGQWGNFARAFDISPERTAGMKRQGVLPADSARDALSGVSLALSLVTADAALSAARASVKHITKGTLWCDMNSVAPETKQAAARAIESAGGRYVDVAVMSPVNPARLATPLLVSGPHAAAAITALAALGFSNMRAVGDEVGRASTIKMLRSVMYKGVEALTAECLIACEKAGVTDEVLGSFGHDWASSADYRLDRMMVHGLRRSAEMAEVVKTLETLGIDPVMTRGTVRRQAAIGALGIKEPPAGLAAKLEALK